MFKRSLLALVAALCLWAGPAAAQNVMCADRPSSDSSNACANTRFVKTAPLSPGQITLAQYSFLIGNASNVGAATVLAGDCAYGASGIICTKTNGVNFGYFATGTDAANLTGTLGCLQLPSFTGEVTNSACALTIANGAVTNAKLAPATANTVKGAAASTAVTDLAVPSCSAATSALTWSTGSGFGCNTITGSLPDGYVAPAVVADGQFITDAAQAGTSTLTSASNPFVSGDTGKTMQCGEGANLHTGTITYVSAGSVTVSWGAATYTGGSCQWGTDNTTTINNAITGLTQGGTVLLPTGYIMVSSINMTNTLSVGLVGASCGINGADYGTVLIGTTASNNRPVIDLTGAQGPTISCLQIHATRSPVAPGAAILIANSNTAFATLVYINRVFATGYYQNATIYAYGIQDSYIENSIFWIYSDTLYGQVSGQIVAYLSRDNVRGMGSDYATIGTGNQPTSNILWHKGELHDYKPSGGASSGTAVWLRGAGVMTFTNYLLDSSTSALGIVYSEQATDTTDTSRAMFVNSTFYNENGTAAANCILSGSGTMASTTILNASFTCTTQRSGTVTYLGLQTP